MIATTPQDNYDDPLEGLSRTIAFMCLRASATSTSSPSYPTFRFVVFAIAGLIAAFMRLVRASCSDVNLTHSTLLNVHTFVGLSSNSVIARITIMTECVFCCLFGTAMNDICTSTMSPLRKVAGSLGSYLPCGYILTCNIEQYLLTFVCLRRPFCSRSRELGFLGCERIRVLLTSPKCRAGRVSYRWVRLAQTRWLSSTKRTCCSCR